MYLIIMVLSRAVSSVDYNIIRESESDGAMFHMARLLITIRYIHDSMTQRVIISSNSILIILIIIFWYCIY